MIDSNQDEAVKLEAAANRSDLALCPFDAQPADVEHLENGRWSVGCQDEDCLGYMSRTTYARKAEAVAAWNTRTLPPANLNAPDKQEALAEGARELLDQARALRDFVFDRTPGGEAASREGRRLRLLASDHVNRVEALRTLPSNEALAGDDRNGVEWLADRVVNEIMDAFQKSGGLASILDQCANASAKIRSTIWLHVHGALSRTPSSPQADEADVERERLAQSLEGYARGYDKLHRDIADDFRKAATIVRSTMTTRPAPESDGWRCITCKTVVMSPVEPAQCAWCPGREFAHVAPSTRPAGPIPMLLFCPTCGLKHVDEPDPDGATSVEISGRESRWDNPPHRSHLCHGCGAIWRPADVPTNGVARIETTGKADTIDLNEVPSLTRPAGGEEVDACADVRTAAADALDILEDGGKDHESRVRLARSTLAPFRALAALAPPPQAQEVDHG